LRLEIPRPSFEIAADEVRVTFGRLAKALPSRILQPSHRGKTLGWCQAQMISFQKCVAESELVAEFFIGGKGIQHATLYRGHGRRSPRGKSMCCVNSPSKSRAVSARTGAVRPGSV